MKILHYVSHFSLPSETFIYDLINNLENHEIDNYILTHYRELKDERPFSKVKIISEKTSFIKKVYFKLFKQWQIRNKEDVLKYIEELKPDLIHAHFGPNGIKIYKLLKQFKINIPIVVSFHGMDINVLPLKDLNYLNAVKEMNQDDNVVFTSPSIFLKNKMTKLSLTTNKTYILYNAYNNVFNNISKTNFWKYGDELNLLNIGRFAEVKGQVYLIKAFKKVVDFYPNSKLTLIGYGSLEYELKQLVEELNLLDRVLFLKQVEHKSLPSIMSKYDIYLQPSIVASDGAEESLSVSTIEAQAVGLPSIVSNIGGLKEVVVDGKTGYLIDDKDIDLISNKIKSYIKNGKLLKEHSNNSIIFSSEKFNSERIIQKWIKMYRSIKNDI